MSSLQQHLRWSSIFAYWNGSAFEVLAFAAPLQLFIIFAPTNSKCCQFDVLIIPSISFCLQSQPDSGHFTLYCAGCLITLLTIGTRIMIFRKISAAQKSGYVVRRQKPGNYQGRLYCHILFASVPSLSFLCLLTQITS